MFHQFWQSEFYTMTHKGEGKNCLWQPHRNIAQKCPQHTHIQWLKKEKLPVSFLSLNWRDLEDLQLSSTAGKAFSKISCKTEIDSDQHRRSDKQVYL